MADNPKQWSLITRVVSGSSDPPEALSPTIRVQLAAETDQRYDLEMTPAAATALCLMLSNSSPVAQAMAHIPKIGPFRADPLVPVVEAEITPAHEDERAALHAALSALSADDPQFRFTVDETTGAAKIAGIDELQLDNKVYLLHQRDRLTPVIGAPQIAYRETIGRRAEIDYTHKAQRFGAGQYARVQLIVEPNPLDDANLFQTQLAPVQLPPDYVLAIEKGVRSALAFGIVHGFPVLRTKVFLVGGVYHPTDSSALSFELAARAATRELLGRAGPVLLEPVMRVQIVTPEDCVPVIIKDLQSRRGLIEQRGRRCSEGIVINADVPATNLFGYRESLRYLSGDRAGHRQQFDHYAPLPGSGDPPFRLATGLRA